jgi:hypothetical protein
MRAASGFLDISHSPFNEVRDHRGPVTAVLLARLIARAPPSGSDNGGQRDRATGTAVEDGKAIAREISLAKPLIRTGQRWALILCLLHSLLVFSSRERFGRDMTEGQSRKRLAGKILSVLKMDKAEPKPRLGSSPEG